MNETASWIDCKFTVYEPSSVIWHEVPGLYVFAFRGKADPAHHQWRAVYVGRTHNFATRLPNHEKWQEAERLGATHIHARVIQPEGAREVLEHLLILEYQPILNVQYR